MLSASAPSTRCRTYDFSRRTLPQDDLSPRAPPNPGLCGSHISQHVPYFWSWNSFWVPRCPSRQPKTGSECPLMVKLKMESLLCRARNLGDEFPSQKLDTPELWLPDVMLWAHKREQQNKVARGQQSMPIYQESGFNLSSGEV